MKYRRNSLCWGINIKTLGIFYVDIELEEFELDPNENILGVFK